MTVPTLHEGTLTCDDTTLLTGLGPELQLDAAEPYATFLTVQLAVTTSRHVVQLGTLAALDRFTACHRYEPYWMKPMAGTRPGDAPPETQYLLARRTDGSWLLLVPLIDELVRYSLRGDAKSNALELVGETGDAHRAAAGGIALYLAWGSDPDALVRDGARRVTERLGMGKLRAAKPLPDFVDWFGWCTWDAFYQEVSAARVVEGLETFAAGGTAPRFLILDDGWQQTRRTPTGEDRLTGFGANERFAEGLASLVQHAKKQLGIQWFLVWHAVTGYWGGVDPEALPGYDVIEQPRHFGAGILHHSPEFNEKWWGALVGFVPPTRIAEFYDAYHASLAAAGVDGVKVDQQAVLESLAQGQGGRVPTTLAYRQALEASAQRHFGGRLINCMSNAQETWYGSPGSTLLRSSIDFFPREPETHGAHLYTNAQVGLWFGELMQPDWDMFQSGHEFGSYHAAGRALSGGPVYVSDVPGQQDFALLRKLVCRDGRVLRCDHPGLPTHDVLCHDPTRERLLLKIRNRCGAAGIVGAFNAHTSDDARGEPPIAGHVAADDVPGLDGERFAVFAHVANRLDQVGPHAKLGVELGHAGFELFTFVPLVNGCAVIGLADKLNSAGAVVCTTRTNSTLAVELHDGGELVALVTAVPRAVAADGLPTTFTHDPASGELRITVPPPLSATTMVLVHF